MATPPSIEGKILIITLTGDLHVPYVTKHLKSETVQVDPSRILDKCELSYLHDGRTTTLIYDSKPITNIKSVWYRRPYNPERQDIKVPQDYKDYSYSSIRKHTQDLYGLFQDAFWLTDYYTLLKAEIKPRQLEAAATIGFRTPKTLTTSSKTTAATFLEKTGDSITKSMATTLPIVDGKVQHFYTTRIPRGKKLDLEGLHLAPSIFQEAIDVEQGLRVTVVDNQVFAASVQDLQHKDYPNIIDWRRAYTDNKLQFKSYDLPRKLQSQCINLTKVLNLRFGVLITTNKRGQLLVPGNQP